MSLLILLLLAGLSLLELFLWFNVKFYLLNIILLLLSTVALFLLDICDLVHNDLVGVGFFLSDEFVLLSLLDIIHARVCWR